MPRNIDGDFAALPPLLETTWPEALPHPEEEHFLSVICEKQALWWCLHAKDGDNEGSSSYPWKAARFWKSTASLLETPRRNLTLSNFVPPAVRQDFLGGKQTPVNQEDGESLNNTAKIHSFLTKQRIPAWTIYAVIAETSPHDIGYQKALQQIFCEIPNRIYFLSAKDFIAAPNINLLKVSLSQLASLKAIWDDDDHHESFLVPSPPETAAVSTSPTCGSSSTATERKKSPVLFFHADEHVVSYVATDRDGNILGEGGFPGLTSQWEAMEPHVEGLSLEQWGSLLREFPMDITQPTPSLFSTSGKRPQMLLNGMIQMLRTSLQQAEGEWKRCCLGNENGSAAAGSSSSRPVIFVDGLHAQLVHHLLVRAQPADSQQADKVVVYRQSLANYGVAAALQEKVLQFEKVREEEEQALRRLLVGQRLLHSKDELGTVVAVIKGAMRDSYRVQYDQGHWRDYQLRELPAELQRFHILPEENRLVKIKQKGSYAASLKILEIIERAKPALQKRPREPEEENGLQQSPKRLVTDTNGMIPNDVPVAIDLTGPPANAAGDALAEQKMAYVGRRLAKFFYGILYFGTVMEWKPPEEGEEDYDLWLVVYDDTDREDMDKKDLDTHLELYEQYKTRDANARH